jgi:hypothetical protein
MTSGSLTWGAELDEMPDGSNTTPFSEENTVMMVYGGCPCWGGTACPAWALGSQLTMVWPRGVKGVTAQVFHHLNKDTNIYIYIYILTSILQPLQGAK